MPPARRPSSNGRSPLVRKQSQITTFFTPGKTPQQSPSPSPSPNPYPKPSKEEQKKTPLLIPLPSISNPKTPPTAIGKKVRIFWPLDKAWYEGRVKSFDQETGKHRIMYDDGEAEELDLGKEKHEWVEEERPSKLRRLRRVSTVEVKKESSGEGEDDSGDEDWGKGNGKDKEEEEDSEEMQLEDEEEEEEVVAKKSKSGRGKGKSCSVSVGSSGKGKSCSVSVGSSGKRKKVDVEKLGVSKKFRFDGDDDGQKGGDLCGLSASNNRNCDVSVAAKRK